MVDKIESAESSASSAMKMATLAGLEASDKQDRLVSGSNIKTINYQSILGSGNIIVDTDKVEKYKTKDDLDANGSLAGGDIAAVVDALLVEKPFTECYQPTRSEIEANPYNKKFTKVDGLVLNPDFNPNLISSNYGYLSVGLYSDGKSKGYHKEYPSHLEIEYDYNRRIICWEYDGTSGSGHTLYGSSGFNASNIDRVNNILREGDFRFSYFEVAYRENLNTSGYTYYYSYNDNFPSDATAMIDSFVKMIFAETQNADIYVRSAEWVKLLKEGDVTGGGADKTLTFYAPIDDVSLSDAEKQHNAESYQKVAEGFESDTYYDIKILLSTTQLVALDVIKTINPAIDNGRLKLIFGGGGFGLDLQRLIVTSDGSATITIEGIEESGVELRDLYIYENYDGTLTELTDEQKAWNLETLELAKQGKAIVRTTLHGNTFILELFNEDNDYQFGYTQFSPSGGVAISVGVTEDGLSGIKIEESHFDSELSTTSINAVQNKVITAALNNKVDKVNGKQLSTEDFTSVLKTKLESLRNYDDTSIQNAVNSLTTQINTLVSSDASVAIENFNEIISFLNGIEDSESLDSIIASIEQQIANKQNIITDLTDIRNGAALGKTALQSIPTEYVTDSELIAKGYATTSQLVKKQDVISDLESIRSGAVLGTTSLQEHQDISHLATKEAVTNLTNDVLDNEEIYAAAVNDLNMRVVNTDSTLSTEISNRESLQTEFQTFKTQVTENEEVWTIALTDINDRIDINYQHGKDTYATKNSLSTEIQTINTVITDNEEVIAATLTDLNNQIASLNVLITDLTNRIETLENA